MKRKLKHAKFFAVSVMPYPLGSDIPWLAQSGVYAQSEPCSYRSLPVGSTLLRLAGATGSSAFSWASSPATCSMVEVSA